MNDAYTSFLHPIQFSFLKIQTNYNAIDPAPQGPLVSSYKFELDNPFLTTATSCDEAVSMARAAIEEGGYCNVM